MKKVLIDTNTYCQAFIGNTWAEKILKQADEILLCPIVAGELFSGFKKGSRESDNMAIFNKFLLTPRVTILSISLETSEFYSLIFGQLKKNGTPIPTNDIWIAASAMERGAHLATMDKHFQYIAGLLTVYPEVHQN